MALILRRIFEIAISLPLIFLFTLPIGIAKFAKRIFTGKPVFEKKAVYGKNGAPLEIVFFNSRRYFVRKASLFVYVLTGKIALVGIGIEDYGSRPDLPENAYLLRDKPGIFNLWFVRESGKIGHEGKIGTEWEYVFRRDLSKDIVLILKSIPAALMRSEGSAYRPEINLLNVKFRNMRMLEALEFMEKSIVSGDRKKVFFINPDCLNKSVSDREYADNLAKSDIVLPDGSGINLACKIMGTHLIENVNGTDMFPFICRLSAEKSFKIFLLGAKPGIADAVRKNCESNYPGVKFCGVRDGYFDKAKESAKVISEINEADPDFLLVAFGAPYQEKWITEHFSALGARVCIGVGGLFDFYSGRIPRAPKWMRELGLEWIFRLLQEPARMWKRYVIGNPLFVFRVLKWKAFMEDSNGNK